MGMVTKTTYANTKNILIGQDSYHISLPCIVGNAGVTAVDGKKILKAGTPLTGDITNRDTAFTKATGSNAVGILLHDVNAKNEQQNAQVLIFGFVDISKLDNKQSGSKQDIKNW